MAFEVRVTLQRIQGYAAASGHFQDSMIGEPKSPPGGPRPTAAVFMNSASVAQVMADGATLEVHVVTLRIYRDMLEDSVEVAEVELADAVSYVAEDILGEFDLGATIRHVDAAGIYGQGVTYTWGYVSIGDKMYRSVDIQLPCVVDGSVTMAA